MCDKILSLEKLSDTLEKYLSIGLVTIVSFSDSKTEILDSEHSGL